MELKSNVSFHCHLHFAVPPEGYILRLKQENLAGLNGKTQLFSSQATQSWESFTKITLFSSRHKGTASLEVYTHGISVNQWFPNSEQPIVWLSHQGTPWSPVLGGQEQLIPKAKQCPAKQSCPAGSLIVQRPQLQSGWAVCLRQAGISAGQLNTGFSCWACYLFIHGFRTLWLTYARLSAESIYL